MRWALLVLFAALPLQWLLIPGVPVGAQRVHVLAILLFAAYVFLRYRARAFPPVVAIAWPFLVTMAALLVMWFATSLYHGLMPRAPMQEAAQLIAFVPVAAVIYRAALRPETGVLDAARWAALACGVSLFVVLSISMLINGVDPISLLSRTVTTGDPEILERELFRSSFAGLGYDADNVMGNLRHEVMGAVLTSMFLSAAATRLRPLTTTVSKRLYQASFVLCTVLIVVSLSRSVILAALFWPVLAVLRALLTRQVTTRQLLVSAGAGATLVVVAASGFLSVLYTRFALDTDSYASRGRLYDRSIANLMENWVTGGVETASASSHNFVLDTWLRTGVFGALAALLVVVLIVGLWFVLIGRLGVEPAWMLPVTALIALPIVRMFTAGGGVLGPVQWVALAIVAGFMAYRAQVRAQAWAVPDSRPAGVPVGQQG